MKTALRVIDVAIGAAVFAYEAVRDAGRRVKRWPMPPEPIRTDPAERLGGLSNESIDFLMSRDSTRRS